jgi:hypothetical protein
LGGVGGGGGSGGSTLAHARGVGDGGRGGVGLGGVGGGGGRGGSTFAHTTQLPALERVVVYPAVAKNTRVTITPIMRNLRVMVFFSFKTFKTLYSSLDAWGLRA